MREATDICLRTTRSSIVKPARIMSARRPSSAIPLLNELKIDNETRTSSIDDACMASYASTINVYLRLKPRLTKLKRVKKIQNDTYDVTSSTSLTAKFPSQEGSTNCTKKSKSPERNTRRFNFTKIFGAECTQSELFEETTKRRLVDFLGGRSFVLMTYGTTNSGKSYSLHGIPESPGIIPRSIEFVFSGVNCTLSPWYKPTNYCEVASLNEAERCHEIGLRDSLLASRSAEKSVCEETWRLLENSTKEDSDCEKNGDAMYSVWLSFVEIYNENIYDLLVDDETRAKLTPLRLVKDKQGRAFVQGSRTICVTTGLEAYRILMAGRSKLTVGSTNLNPQSSRSHSIFTVKLLKYAKERAPEEVEVSTMTFCDLAGTGRSRISAAAGNELSEAKNINTSLLVLGRCLKIVADCQTSRQNIEVIGPFRESKLTRLFQRGISGKENVCLIVNVDTSPEVQVETQAVLNFATIAKKIIVETANESKRSYVRELAIASPKNLKKSASTRPKTVAVIESSGKSEVVESEVEQLRERTVYMAKEISNLREAALNRENEIRQEMANLYSGIIKDVEGNWQKRTKDVEDEKDDFFKWSVKQIEIFYNERIDSLTNRKRRRTSGGDQRDDRSELCQELEAENSRITAKVVALRKKVNKLEEELDASTTGKSKCVFELSLAKETLKQVRRLLDEEKGESIVVKEDVELVDELRCLIDERNETIKNLKKCLEDANNERVKVVRNSIDEIEKIDPKSLKTRNTSILESLTLEQLENELRKRTRQSSDAQESIDVDKSIVVEERQLEGKIFTSTFRKESNEYLPSSMGRFSIIEADDSIPTEVITTERYPSFYNDESMKSLPSSFFQTFDKVIVDESTGKDSGIDTSSAMSSSLGNTVSHVTEEKSSQTSLENFDRNGKINEIVRERVEQLKLDYTKLKAEHLQETMRVTELSRELEAIQYAVAELKESTRQNEIKILDYQDKLAWRETDLSNIGRSKVEIEARLSEVTRQLELCSIAYEKKIVGLRDELKTHEENENRAISSLEECQERSASLEGQLFVALDQIDRNSIKHVTVHVPKLEKLEKELSEKTLRVGELDEKMLKFEYDLRRVYELNERVTNFGTIFDEYQREKDELVRQLTERSETQSSLEAKIKGLTSVTRERDDEILSLRTDLANIVRMNMENSDRARELKEEIAIANGRLADMRGEMTRSEEERRRLDRMSGNEIGNFIAGLADFEKNVKVLARMKASEESRMDELDRIKRLLHEKEREMCIFKKNHDKTVRRYEGLIKKLQDDVELRCNRESSKLRMLYPKRSISKESLKSMAESLRWKATLRRSVEKVRSCKRVSEPRKCRRCYPACSTIVKRSSSRALFNSTTSLEGSRSSECKQFSLGYDDDEEESPGRAIIETEFQTELNSDIVECRDCGRRDGLSQAAATFSIPYSSDESSTDFHDIPEWMDIRRTNARTHFRMRNPDLGDASEEKSRI